jgi:hypothetical protein
MIEETVELGRSFDREGLEAYRTSWDGATLTIEDVCLVSGKTIVTDFFLEKKVNDSWVMWYDEDEDREWTFTRWNSRRITEAIKRAVKRSSRGK